MKKLFYVLLCVACVSLVSCGSEEKKAEDAVSAALDEVSQSVEAVVSETDYDYSSDDDYSSDYGYDYDDAYDIYESAQATANDLYESAQATANDLYKSSQATANKMMEDAQATADKMMEDAMSAYGW